MCLVPCSIQANTIFLPIHVSRVMRVCICLPCSIFTDPILLPIHVSRVYECVSVSPVASRQTLFFYQFMFLRVMRVCLVPCSIQANPILLPIHVSRVYVYLSVPQERRLSLMSQLQPSQQPLARIKLKLLGSTGVGKSTLVEALKCSYLGSFFKRRLHPPGATSVAAKNTKSECKCAVTVDGKVFKGFSLFYYRIIKKSPGNLWT